MSFPFATESEASHDWIMLAVEVQSDITPTHVAQYWICFHVKELLICRHPVGVCVSHGPRNKQRLFPQTALTGWAL
jgi:hypothetical protein